MALLRNLLGTTPPASGDAPNVEDVFSTYLYTGIGSGTENSIDNGINLGDFGVGTSTEFDLPSYLSRSTDLTGNTDPKTFTLSAWVYKSRDSDLAVYTVLDSAPTYPITNINENQIILYNDAGTVLFNCPYTKAIPSEVWSHLLISVDMNTQSNCKVYINDIDRTNITTFSTGSSIPFNQADHIIGSGFFYAINLRKQTMAHFFLDYTYRDLTVESNRRLFIDANGGSTSPATLSALNPIMYLPMTEGYSIGENIGTGGDFTANGSPSIVNKGTEYVEGSGDGGMVWIKGRDYGIGNNCIFDTDRGIRNVLYANENYYENQVGSGSGVDKFNSSGFVVKSGNDVNENNRSLTSWTFRKAPRFFDVVTYTGNGVAGREIAHNLGVVPGMMFVKRTDAAEEWTVYHRSIGATKHLRLDVTAAQATSSSRFNDTEPTSSVFTLGTYDSTNMNNAEYVAYVFAHDPDGADDDGMIACGSVTLSGMTSVSLGWEAQYVLCKPISAGNWVIFDNMRGVVTGGEDAQLKPNLSSAEVVDGERAEFNSDGFSLNGSELGNTEYIYTAIRAPMMVEPESGTEVFASRYGNLSSNRNTGFTPIDSGLKDYDWHWWNEMGAPYTTTKLTGWKSLYTASISAEGSTAYQEIAPKNGWLDYTGAWDNTATTDYDMFFKRAKGFFDIVAYSGNGSYSGRNITHNLGVAPEMMIIKQRLPSAESRPWTIYHSGLDSTSPEDYRIHFDGNSRASGAGMWNSTIPTDSVFTVGGSTYVNNSGEDYIAYLFASLDGISKVGSYTGTGGSSLNTIDCGFSNAARFVLFKRASSGGEWYCFDSARGITSGTSDPVMWLDGGSSTESSRQGANMISPHSSGFSVQNGELNYSGSTWIFLAIA